MSKDIRDDFAMAALQGLLSNPHVVGHDHRSGWSVVNCTEHQLVDYAYNLADIAMVIREPQPTGATP